MLASLALDGFGWLGVEPDSLGVSELAGAVAVLTGTAMIVRAQAEGSAGRLLPGAGVGWLALGLLAGAALPVQGAVNAELRADLDAPLAVGALSFLVATAAMGLLLAASLARADVQRPRLAPLRCVPWWGWLGGLVGATYVTAVFSLIPEIGAAATIALTVGGQQIASVFVDRLGLFKLPRRPVSGLRLAAVGALLTGVALIQLA
jgi:bacterial/archaeal transporter family-2 protein